MPSRIAGHVAARDIIAPLTGELLAAAGEKVSKETAAAAEAAGVSLVYLTVDGKEVKVFTNGTVDAKEFLSFDPAECGINERVQLCRAARHSGRDRRMRTSRRNCCAKTTTS